MPLERVIEGTDEELATILQTGVLAGRHLRLIVDQETEDLTAGLPDPPFAVKDQDHLIKLLSAGIESLDAGNGIEVSASYWNDLRHELKGRAERTSQES